MTTDTTPAEPLILATVPGSTIVENIHNRGVAAAALRCWAEADMAADEPGRPVSTLTGTS